MPDNSKLRIVYDTGVESVILSDNIPSGILKIIVNTKQLLEDFLSSLLMFISTQTSENDSFWRPIYWADEHVG